MFVAALAQHCHRIASIVTAVTVVGDTYVRDELTPPARHTDAYASYKERMKAAKVSCGSSCRGSWSPSPVLCALTVYMRALLLLKDAMQKALSVRLGEQEGSHYIDPVDKLIEV